MDGGSKQGVGIRLYVAGDEVVKPGMTHASLSIGRPPATEPPSRMRNHPSEPSAWLMPKVRVVLCFKLRATALGT